MEWGRFRGKFFVLFFPRILPLDYLGVGKTLPPEIGGFSSKAFLLSDHQPLRAFPGVTWLEQGIIPGAVKKETPVGSCWLIPESALRMERPKTIRKY